MTVTAVLPSVIKDHMKNFNRAKGFDVSKPATCEELYRALNEAEKETDGTKCAVLIFEALGEFHKELHKEDQSPDAVKTPTNEFDELFSNIVKARGGSSVDASKLSFGEAFMLTQYDVNFTYPDTSAIVPQPEWTVSVMANADQLVKHHYAHLYYWEVARTSNGDRMPNRMRTRFESIEKARVLYDDLQSKGLVALKNWLE